MDRLSFSGYRLTFRAEPRGLEAVETGNSYEPESLVVDETLRFEGPTDPADEAVVFALRCPATGARGTFVTAYGAMMGANEAAATRRLGRGQRASRSRYR